MSQILLLAGEGYLHSPVDDLESFFWVTLRSAMFNTKSGQQWSIPEEKVKKALFDIKKDEAIQTFTTQFSLEECNSATQRFHDVIADWWDVVHNRQRAWVSAILRKCPKGAGKEYYLPHFHRFALPGVLEFLEVLVHNHWGGVINWKSWTSGPI